MANPLPNSLRDLRRRVDDRRRKWWIERNIGPMPTEAIVPLDRTEDVLLLCSHMIPHFDPKITVQELAFAHELANSNREFAIACRPDIIFEKSVAWFLPNRLVSPPLWDYSRQVQEFAAGLERQENRLFCSSQELRFWENKAAMHKSFREIGVSTPETRILTEADCRSTEFDLEPVLIKEEHSSGSAGIHFFERAEAAREFVMSYPFRPLESLIMQEVVHGATKDLRVTMVGDQMIPSATFWRVKTPVQLESVAWTTSASKYGSAIDHENIPEDVAPILSRYLRNLDVRAAGIDVMWVDDDVSRTPLILELSPYFQPNPPKPARYETWSYRKYKGEAYAKDGYFLQQYRVFREMAAQMLDQKLY
jgi:hypothetical protein